MTLISGNPWVSKPLHLSDGELDMISRALRDFDARGIAEFSENTIAKAVTARMEALGLPTTTAFIEHLKRDHQECQRFFADLGTGERSGGLTARDEAERVVSRLGIRMLSEQDTNAVIEMALGALLRNLETDLAAVFEFRPSEWDLALRAGSGWREPEPSEALLSSGFDIHGGSTFVVPNLREEKRFPLPSWLEEQGAASGMGTAIRRPGDPYGALTVFSRSLRLFSDVEIDFLEAVAALLAAALDRDYMERMLVETRDRLTLADARQAAERAEQLASLGTLAAGISHEINNPLNSILVNAELGLMKLETGQGVERIRPILETIVEEVRRCARITQSVLNLAKSTDTPKASADLNDIILRARELVATHLQLHDTAVTLELGELPALHLDADAMESAMVNLLRNAAESSRQGVTVSVQSRLESDGVIVQVSDDGPGIAPEHRDHVFDPFYSTKRSNKGTGLGLSLVHRTITDHGGTIQVVSEVGKGTTFEMRLPLSHERTDVGD